MTEGVTAGEQRGAGGGAVGHGDVAIGEASTLGGHAVEVRRFVGRAAEAAEVATAEIIGQNNDEIRKPGGPEGGKAGGQELSSVERN